MDLVLDLQLLPGDHLKLGLQNPGLRFSKAFCFCVLASLGDGLGVGNVVAGEKKKKLQEYTSDL